MIELLLKPLSNREWVLLGVLQGATGGAVALALAALWSLTQGEALAALGAPLLLPCLVLGSALNALLGIPLYRWLVGQAELAAKPAPGQDKGNAA